MSGYWLTLHDSVDPSWWRPLERLAAQLKDRSDLPPLDPDDYVYCARIPLGANLPVMHVYRNVLTQRYLNIDELAFTWRYVGHGSGYALCELSDAIRRADLERADLLAGRTRRGFRRPRPAAPVEAPPVEAPPVEAPPGADGVAPAPAPAWPAPAPAWPAPAEGSDPAEGYELAEDSESAEDSERAEESEGPEDDDAGQDGDDDDALEEDSLVDAELEPAGV